MTAWSKLPKRLQSSAVRPYYDSLKGRTASLRVKRAFDIVFSAALLILLSPLMLIIASIVKFGSPGPVFFRQERVTKDCRNFFILKFRSMEASAENAGATLTAKGDTRVTKAGKALRKYRLDEIPQLVNILKGDMSFVGARPELPKYVDFYTEEMLATLLLPAGLTSSASIKFAEEDTMLEGAADLDKFYIESLLPVKMQENLKYISNYSFFRDLKIIFMTALAIVR